ncbi:MAG: hypothetical protein ACR2GY_05440 [Phycisphaerales bacterium]
MLIGLTWLLLLSGCQAGPWGNPKPPPGRAEATRTAMAKVAHQLQAADAISTVKIAPAPSRGRWEDVEDAVVWAIDEGGIEMGILTVHEFDWGRIYDLRTVEGWPATLRVEKAAGDRVYQRTASVGRFPDMPARRDRARKLEEAFDRWMHDLGKKRKPVPMQLRD